MLEAALMFVQASMEASMPASMLGVVLVSVLLLIKASLQAAALASVRKTAPPVFFLSTGKSALLSAPMPARTGASTLA